jgi:hypothetical protein
MAIMSIGIRSINKLNIDSFLKKLIQYPPPIALVRRIKGFGSRNWTQARIY